ncbi:MAG: MFS transporter [Gammaproteobacteria bacterium]|nr:MFS transporter [Gammaproteobacteria bacterium]
MPPSKRGSALPRGVWALGFVSLFMDMSSEMIHSLLPVFLVGVLGASPTLVGLIEGLGDAVTPVSKLFSGWASDRLGRRKPFALFGYGLALFSKPLFAIAPNPGWVFAARVSDRLAKGIRGAPRDALVADLTPEAQRGTAYGLRQSLDSVGAFAGPIIALVLMERFHDNFRLVFWVAALPALACVTTLALFVKEPAKHAAARDRRTPIRWSVAGSLGSRFWSVAGVGGILMLARFSEAFLVLRAHNVGLATALMPAVLIVMNIVYSASAYLAGVLADRIDRRIMLRAGFGALIAADLILAFGDHIGAIMAGVALWGLHMGLTQGLLAALIADSTSDTLRGTAFGVFSFVSGLTMLAASVGAGYLWQTIGPSAAFLAGAGIAGAGLSVTVVAAYDR